jgi:hypothetical protein
MRSLCCLSVYPSVFFHLSVFSPNSVRRLMRTLCCLCICVPPNFFVFYAVHVVTKESRPLVLPGISYVYCGIFAQSKNCGVTATGHY